MKSLFALISSALFFFISCNHSSVDEINRGAGYNYRPGYPELRMSSTGFVDQDNTSQIVVSGDVVFGSLVYAEKNSKYEAAFTIDIEIFADTEDRSKAAGTQFSELVSSVDDKVINSQDTYSFEKVFEVPPGNYTIEAIITDRRSGRQSRQVNTTSVPNPDDSVTHLTEIRILGKDEEADRNYFIPINTYDVASRFDTLQFVFQVTNTKPNDPITIESRLLKFQSDTTAAKPMSFNSPTPSSLEYKGIEYDRYDEIQTSRRTISQSGSVVIEFKFANLEMGNYRLEVAIADEEDSQIYSARDFAIKSENYPSLKSAKELAEPLIYIMDDKEYDRLISIEDQAELKKAIDRFWLKNTENSNKARQVISLYYQRVEEANKMFSNFKAGWKTDPGMIYILFGPPWYVDNYLEYMTWSYSYNSSDAERNFIFEKPRMKTKYFPFEHYILRRSSHYYNLYYQQVENWRSGRILNTNL